MRMVSAVFSLAVVFTVVIVGCKPSPYVPDGGVDGGVDPTVITAADIGTPCVYNPARPDESPTNQCRGGLECAIVTREIKEAILNTENPTSGFNTMGLTLPLIEDHLTVQNFDGTDTGYCTLLGTISAPPLCPIGTLQKAFSSTVAGGLVVACLKPCTVGTECAAGAVCDARYFDDGGNGEVGFCVRPCENDYPDCLRTAVVPVDPANSNTFVTQIANIDMLGGRTCNETSGKCGETGVRGIGNDGDECDDSANCANGAVCIQNNARGERLDKGFCARRCFVGSDDNGLNGTCGTELCQPALGYGLSNMAIYDPNGFFPDLPLAGVENTDTRIANGLCFETCVDGFGCGSRTDVQCGQVDAEEAGGPWNGRTMCIPEGILFETE